MMTDDEITEKWIRTAKEIGFSEAGVLNPETLKVMPLVRETCAEDKCHAYNHNWTCPPACGTLDECERRMRAYKRGILVQTTGVLRRDIDTRIYRETEKLHTEYLKILREQMMEEFPDMLMLGAAWLQNLRAMCLSEAMSFPGESYFFYGSLWIVCYAGLPG